MHTVELLEQAIALASDCGFGVRQDWFGGAAAGACEFKGRRWIFIDLALSPAEQLGHVLDALLTVPDMLEVDRQPAALSPPLARMLRLHKAA